MTSSQQNYLLNKIDEISALINELKLVLEHQVAQELLLAKLQAAANMVLHGKYDEKQWNQLVQTIKGFANQALSPDHHSAKVLNVLLKPNRSEVQIQPVHKNRYLQM